MVVIIYIYVKAFSVLNICPHSKTSVFIHLILSRCRSKASFKIIYSTSPREANIEKKKKLFVILELAACSQVSLFLFLSEYRFIDFG